MVFQRIIKEEIQPLLKAPTEKAVRPTLNFNFNLCELIRSFIITGNSSFWKF